MESESSGTTDDRSFTQSAEGWDNAMTHDVTTCDHNLHHMSVRDAAGIYMETAEDENMVEEKCFRPSHLCKEQLCLHPTEESFRLQSCDVSLSLSEGELPSARCYLDLNQDVRPVLQQVARLPEWTRHDCSVVFFERFHCHHSAAATSPFFTFTTSVHGVLYDFQLISMLIFLHVKLESTRCLHQGIFSVYLSTFTCTQVSCLWC